MALVNVLLLVCVASVLTVAQADSFDVTQYGAVGDGKTDDTQAFLKAWEAACGASGGSSILTVPSGKNFFLNPLVFMGPCKSSAIEAQIDGTLVAPGSQGKWKNCASNTWIVFQSVDGLKISGTGTLNARGSDWWGASVVNVTKDTVQTISNGGCNKPTTFRLINCNSGQLTKLSFLNSGGNHISISNCKNLKIFNINIKAPENSPNTDGINLFDSSDVSIDNSLIGTGDDCIAISNNCHHINISDIQCGPGHGISVGSLGKDGSSAAVDGIYVEHCTFTRTFSAARIKTWTGGSGYARNIHYDHLTLNSVRNAIEIYQLYTDNAQSRGVQVSQVHFTNVQGSAQKILLDCNVNAPCDKIFLDHVNITSPSAGKEVEVTCKNAKVVSTSVIPTLSC